MLEKAFETTQIGITITDTESRIIYVNPADAHMHGYTVDELLGQDVGIYAPQKSRQKLDASVLRELRSWSRESVNLRKDGSSFPVQITSDVVVDPSEVICTGKLLPSLRRMTLSRLQLRSSRSTEASSFCRLF